MKKETILKVLRKRLPIRYDKATASEWIDLKKLQKGKSSKKDITEEMDDNNGWLQMDIYLDEIASEIIRETTK
jgi:hypothetical protein